MHSQVCSLAIVTGLVTIGGAAIAAVETDGGMELIDPPPTVQTSQLEADGVIRAFLEGTAFRLDRDLPVDAIGTGLIGEAADAVPGLVVQGTCVQSYYLHFDKVGTSATFQGATGSITFDADVQGLVLFNPSMNATDPLLGTGVTLYPTGEPARGVMDGFDWVEVSADRRTVTFHGSVAQNIDSMRVIVDADCCPADVTGDGTVGFTDLTVLLAVWGPCPDDCIGDINADGGVGFADLLAVVAAWGLCDA